MYRYFSSGEVVHIPARDSQRTQAAVPPVASQHTACETRATDVNAEHTGAWTRDEERDVAEMEAAAQQDGGEEREEPSADENNSAAAVDPNVPESSRPLAFEADGKRSRERTPELASPTRRSVRARQTPRHLLHI